MVLPLMKVAALLIKSIAKPLSKQLKVQVSKSPRIHDSFVGMARLWHKLDVKLSRFTGDTTRKSAELNVNAAIDLGSEMVSEGFLLVVAISILLYENNKSSVKEQKKEELLNNRFKSLEETVQSQSETIKDLQSTIDRLYSENILLKINHPQPPTLILPAPTSPSPQSPTSSNPFKFLPTILTRSNSSSSSGGSNETSSA
eukprot:gene9050-11085_t